MAHTPEFVNNHPGITKSLIAGGLATTLGIAGCGVLRNNSEAPVENPTMSAEDCAPYQTDLAPVISAREVVSAKTNDISTAPEGAAKLRAEADKLDAQKVFDDAKGNFYVKYDKEFEEKKAALSSFDAKINDPNTKESDKKRAEADKLDMQEAHDKAKAKSELARKAADSCGAAAVGGNVVTSSTTATSTPELIPVVDRMQQGDKPCGRVITGEELVKHFTENPNVPATNPAEANSFMDANPNLKGSMANFYDANYSKPDHISMIDWVNTKMPKTDTNLSDGEGDRLKAFYNRLMVVQLTENKVVGNNICEPETGVITDLGAQELQKGDFTYGFNLDQAGLDSFMTETGLTKEDLLLTTVQNGNKQEYFVMVNRSTCNNPLKPVRPVTPPVEVTPPTEETTPNESNPTTSRVTVTTGPTTTLKESLPVPGPSGLPNTTQANPGYPGPTSTYTVTTQSPNTTQTTIFRPAPTSTPQTATVTVPQG